MRLTPQAPEEIEFEKFQERCRILEGELEHAREEFESKEGKLRKFEQMFIEVLGERYRKIDILDYKLKQYLKTEESNNKYKEYTQAEYEYEYIKHTLDEFENSHTFSYLNDETKKFEKKNIKEIYREIVKEIHPDKYEGEKHEIMSTLMSEVNEAYSNNDKERMLMLYSNWKNDPESVSGESIGDKLVRVIRRMYMLENQIKEVESNIEYLRDRDIYRFSVEVGRYKKLGRNLINEICTALDREIYTKQRLVKVITALEDAAKDNKGGKYIRRKY